MRAIIIPPDADPRVEDIAPSREVIHALVGGYFEAHNLLRFDAHMYVNEGEGWPLGKPNYLASELTGKHLWGTAVVFGSHAKPDEGDVPAFLVEALGLT